MKKLLIGFLAVGLIMGFAMTASAQPNIKASGQYYAYGTYVDNVSLLKNGDSRANIANRLRMQFEIQVQEGLKLTTRFDALERVWGQQTVAPAPSPGADGATVERNISWERAYVTFNALYGVFDVGYQASKNWGTCAFCDDYDSDAGIHYRYMMGPWTLGLEWEKRADAGATGEGSKQGGTSLGGTDNDHDVYHIYAIYRWATGQAGLRYEFDRNAADGAANAARVDVTPAAGTYPTNYFSTPFNAPYGSAARNYNPAAPGTAGTPWVSYFHEIAPYMQWISGPFALEAEFRYIWGKTEYDDGFDVDRKGYDLYLMGKYTMGAFYGGLEFAWVSGDDPTTLDKNEAGVPGGLGWDPLLMFGNYWFHKHQGAMGPGTGATVSSNETNLIMFKPFVGWKINPQLEVVAQFAWLKADEKPSGFQDDDYGREFDLYANYKLYNNLTYTVGFGYFWTGDYFKGTNAAIQVDDNYLVMNALNFVF